jgi:hypothetical protein
MSDKIDFLNTDTAIPGQNYCCLSFVSPEKVIKNKETFFMKEFLKDYCKKEKLEYKEVDDKYKDFLYTQQEKLQKEFDNQNNYQTSVRGLKVRGVYDSRQEAEQRAKILHRMDQDHHVFVGSVGQWLPWDPEPDKIADQEYINDELNNMMGEYKKNQISKDQFFQERKNEQMEDQMKKVEESKKKRLEEIEDTEGTDDAKKPEAYKNLNTSQTVEIGDTKEVADEVKGTEAVNEVVQETLNGLEEDDPWLQRKKEEEADATKKSD